MDMGSESNLDWVSNSNYNVCSVVCINKIFFIMKPTAEEILQEHVTNAAFLLDLDEVAVIVKAMEEYASQHKGTKQIDYESVASFRIG